MTRVGSPQLRVALVPWMVAGVRTQYENMCLHGVPNDMTTTTVPILPYKAHGFIERLPFLSSPRKGTLRSMTEALRLFRSRPYDVIWTQSLLSLLPFMTMAAGSRTRPALIYTIDTTPALMDGFTTLYYGRPAAGTLKRFARDALYRHMLRRCAMVTPWSAWAARSFARDYGVPYSRMQILPPGVDLQAWAAPERCTVADRPFRLLFVGADFERKGGPLLLDLFRTRLRERCELHLVTRATVTEEPGVRVYSGFGPNAPGLRALYAQCDALVLPTRADCSPLAVLEAMAGSLPVISCPVGGIPEIVSQDETGLLIPPDDGPALLAAIQVLVNDPQRSLAMGLAGRRVAELRFDNAKQSRALFALLRRFGTDHSAGG